MSDKNPYYSIPKALGEPKEEINFLPVDPKLKELQEIYEWFLDEVHYALTGRERLR